MKHQRREGSKNKDMISCRKIDPSEIFEFSSGQKKIRRCGKKRKRSSMKRKMRSRTKEREEK